QHLPPELSLKVLRYLSLNQWLEIRLVSVSWNEMICRLFGYKFICYIDQERLAQHENSLTQTMVHLSQQNLTIDKVCFLGIDLLASQLKDEKHLDQPFTNCLDHLRELRVRECEVSLKMLCFVVNRIKKLERLQLLKVLFDKSLESKEITL